VRCALCHGPAGDNRLELTLTHQNPTTTVVAQVAVCLDCSHTRQVTPAHLYELARRAGERSTRHAKTSSRSHKEEATRV
jgi:hypothetical protein